MNSTSNSLYVAALLANFFEAGCAIQILVGDASQKQYEASRLTRPEVETQMRIMINTAKVLPEGVCKKMPKIDWQSWAELGEFLPPQDAYSRDLVWNVIEFWLPRDGMELRRYRRQLTQLWRFKT